VIDLYTWATPNGRKISIDLAKFPNVLDWYVRIAQRPAVQSGYDIPVPESVPMP
jgi:glutathione S-transferase